jgi:hypothetical protein
MERVAENGPHPVSDTYLVSDTVTENAGFALPAGGLTDQIVYVVLQDVVAPSASPRSLRSRANANPAANRASPAAIPAPTRFMF